MRNLREDVHGVVGSEATEDYPAERLAAKMVGPAKDHNSIKQYPRMAQLAGQKIVFLDGMA